MVQTVWPRKCHIFNPGHALGIWICGCSLFYRRELWVSKSAGANSTKILKICRCKRWCPKYLQVHAPAVPMLTQSMWVNLCPVWSKSKRVWSYAVIGWEIFGAIHFVLHEIKKGLIWLKFLIKWYLISLVLTSFDRTGNHGHDGNKDSGKGVEKWPNPVHSDRSIPFRMFPA